MPQECLHCVLAKRAGSYFVKFGFFYRTADSRYVQRWRCQKCLKTCSRATFQYWFRHKKRAHAKRLRHHFASGGSIRRAALVFKLNRKTVERKLDLLGFLSEAAMKRKNLEKNKSRVIEFDDLETFEHTKCKPLSVTLAVESRTRRILGLEVSSMPAKGLLVEKAKKYGHRRDTRARGRRELFNAIKDLVHENAVIKSDSNPYYPKDVKKHFPVAKHRVYSSRKGSSTGQGELKKVRYDPLFSLNHTCAMFRANVNRLFRKTWNTTKRADRLRTHLFLYAHYHNEFLLKDN